MIVDEKEDAGDALAMLREISAHGLRAAYNGRGAIALAQTFCQGIAVIDIGLPDMNGYEVAQALRQEPWGETVRLVALTG